MRELVNGATGWRAVARFLALPFAVTWEVADIARLWERVPTEKRPWTDGAID